MMDLSLWEIFISVLHYDIHNEIAFVRSYCLVYQYYLCVCF